MFGYIPTWRNRLGTPTIYSVGKRGGSKHHWRVNGKPACHETITSGRSTGNGYVSSHDVIECEKCKALYQQVVSEFNWLMVLG